MDLIVHDDASALVTALAAELGRLTDAALRERGRALLALAGGRTPLPVYRAFAAQPRDWSRVWLVATDERWVEAADPARNETAIAAAMAAADGLQRVALLPAQPPEPPSTAFAARSLRAFDAPFDAVLLGMGADAHTASLFPGSDGLAAALDPQAAADAFVIRPVPLPPEAPFARISLGLRRLLDSRRRLLAINGVAKREVLDAAAAATDPLRQPIAAFLRPDRAMTVHWSP